MAELKKSVVDPELAAISKLIRILGQLEPDRALRVLSYVKDRMVEDFRIGLAATTDQGCSCDD